MLARFRVLLPFELYVRQGDDLASQAVVFGGYQVTLDPPMRSHVARQDLAPNAETPVSDILNGMEPQIPPPPSAAVHLGGAAGAMVDLVQLRFVRPNFDRHPGSGDPPIDLCFTLANGLLQRIRALTGSHLITPLTPTTTCWRVDYLNDDGSALPDDPDLIRARKGGSFLFAATPVNQAAWQAVSAMPVDFKCSRSLELLLDAMALLPRVGPSLVLTATAIETRTAEVLDYLASQSATPPALWAWITDRDDYRTEPSTEELLDPVMHALMQTSLKDNAALWQAFKNVRGARNKFVHEGEARIGNMAVDAAKATELIQHSWQILEWLDTLVPAERRAFVTVVTPEVVFGRVLVVAPGAGEVAYE
jgi:hypothetical protein